MPPAPSVSGSIDRRVFPAWSIAIPASFCEAFLVDGCYWHAWDERHSVSLSSIVLVAESGPVPAALIMRRFPPLDGTPLDILPPGLLGRAAEAATEQPARATRALSGLLAADGRALVVTIMSDDREWALMTWRSIRCIAGKPDSCT